MIFIVTALQCEAAPFIEELSLKQIGSKSSFRIYANDSVKLIVSGTGGISALEAAVYLLTKYGDSLEDVVVNCGICAVPSDIQKFKGKIFSVSSMLNVPFQRDLYPDMTFDAHFPEAHLMTLAKPYTKGDKIVWPQDQRPLILDMEGAFVFDGASRFVRSRNIHIFKIVSDEGEKRLGPKSVSESIAGHVQDMMSFIYSIQEYGKKDQREILTRDEKDLAEKISEDLSLTVYQKLEFFKLLKNHSVRGKDTFVLLKKHKGIKAGNREKRKERYAKIRKELTEP